MAIDSYSALVSAVIQTSEDDSAEFQTYVPTALDLAEIRLAREVDVLGLTLTATVTAASGVMTMTKPTGYKNGQDLWYINTSSGERVIMKKKPYSYILDYWPVSASTGNPKYYADVDTSTFIVAPTPNTSIAMTLRYEGRPTALTSANPTNFFMEHCADAVFFGTMVEMCKFSRNEVLQERYEKSYQEAVQTLLNEARRQRSDNSGKPMNPTLNTFKGDV
jgi:hypothetical protein